MRIFTEPKIILIGRQQLIGVEELLAEYGFSPTDWRRAPQDTSSGEAIAELMGRLCYGSFGPRQGRVGAHDYMEHILDSGHGSVLEHAVWSFVICRASRGFTHQMVRHRAGMSPSQESQHFIRYSESDHEPGTQEVGVCLTGIPPLEHASYVASVARALDDYNACWRRLKAANPTWPKKQVCERARGLLPNALESRLGITANARALRHFCETRGNEQNALEIRLVAAQMTELMRLEAPSIFNDVETDMAEDGYPIVRVVYQKV